MLIKNVASTPCSSMIFKLKAKWTEQNYTLCYKKEGTKNVKDQK